MRCKGSGRQASEGKGRMVKCPVCGRWLTGKGVILPVHDGDPQQASLDL